MYRSIALLVALALPAAAVAHELPADVPPPPNCNPIGIEKHDWGMVELSVPAPSGKGVINGKIFGPRIRCDLQCAGKTDLAGWAKKLRELGWDVYEEHAQVLARKGESRYFKGGYRLAVIEKGEPRAFSLAPPGEKAEPITADADIPWLLPMPEMSPQRREIVQNGARELWHGTGKDREDAFIARPPFAYFRYAHMKTTLSGAEVSEAYARALEAAGWTLLTRGYGAIVTAHYTKGGRDLWAQVNANDSRTELVAADQGLREAQEELARKLEAEGHVALYGIYFDTGSPALKPESVAALERVKGLLSAAPGLRVEIQGHTDNTGRNPGNQLLSDARAKAVMDWLVQHGIDAARLTAKGYADTKPVADNRTDAGRALNRRVELAKQQ